MSMQWSSSNISYFNISHSFAVLDQMASMDLPRGKHGTRWDALYSEVECKSSKMFDVCTEVPGKSSSTSMWPPNVLWVGPGPSRNRHIQEWAIVLLGGNGFYQGLFQIVTSFPHSVWGKTRILHHWFTHTTDEIDFIPCRTRSMLHRWNNMRNVKIGHPNQFHVKL
jgi:hypothetical protein